MKFDAIYFLLCVLAVKNSSHEPLAIVFRIFDPSSFSLRGWYKS